MIVLAAFIERVDRQAQNIGKVRLLVRSNTMQQTNVSRAQYTRHSVLMAAESIVGAPGPTLVRISDIWKAPSFGMDLVLLGHRWCNQLTRRSSSTTSSSLLSIHSSSFFLRTSVDLTIVGWVSWPVPWRILITWRMCKRRSRAWACQSWFLAMARWWIDTSWTQSSAVDGRSSEFGMSLMVIGPWLKKNLLDNAGKEFVDYFGLKFWGRSSGV